LNKVLDHLYATHATIFDAEEWFDENAFNDAIPDADMERNVLAFGK
jgi:hypothetical protein